MKFIQLLILSSILSSSFAQNNLIITPSNDQFVDEYLVKKFSLQAFQIAQFVSRFNFEKKIPIDNESDNILSLLNLKDKKLISKAKEIGFIDSFSHAKKNKIEYNQNTWYADVNTSFTYRNKPVDVVISMKLDGDEEEGLSWIIFDVSSEIFAQPTFKSPTDFINPHNNEISFSELAKAFVNQVDLANFYSQNKSYSPISSFRDYVLNKDITFNHIKDVQYVFLDVAGYDFTVNYFMRMDMNSGWLISSINQRNP